MLKCVSEKYWPQFSVENPLKNKSDASAFDQFRVIVLRGMWEAESSVWLCVHIQTACLLCISKARMSLEVLEKLGT